MGREDAADLGGRRAGEGSAGTGGLGAGGRVHVGNLGRDRPAEAEGLYLVRRVLLRLSHPAGGAVCVGAFGDQCRGGGAGDRGVDSAGVLSWRVPDADAVPDCKAHWIAAVEAGRGSADGDAGTGGAGVGGQVRRGALQGLRGFDDLRAGLYGPDRPDDSHELRVQLCGGLRLAGAGMDLLQGRLPEVVRVRAAGGAGDCLGDVLGGHCGCGAPEAPG